MGLHCGVDIIEIERIEKALSTGKEAFKKKVFTQSEIEYCESRKNLKYESYAARFAAKEAVAKALGTGIGMGAGLKDIEVLKDENGRPRVVLHGKARETFEGTGGKEISISLSHCKSFAVAYCTIL